MGTWHDSVSSLVHQRSERPKSTKKTPESSLDLDAPRDLLLRTRAYKGYGRPRKDYLPFALYAAGYWMSHVSDSLQEANILLDFLQDADKRELWLYWISHDESDLFIPLATIEHCGSPATWGICFAIAMHWSRTTCCLLATCSLDQTTISRLFIIAARLGFIQGLEIMLSYGATPADSDPRGNSLLHHVAVANIAKGVTLLAGHGANLNQLNRMGRTPLHESLVHISDGQALLALIAHGADLDLPDSRKETALHLAVRYKQPEHIFEIILRQTSVINAKNRDGDTAMHLAARFERRPSLLQLLVDHGADVNLRNKKGKYCGGLR